MTKEEALVTAADIARLTGYGRAAVSNWRRRYDDFPHPVGGTASSPLFALSAVEGWLAAQGKQVEVSEEERLWQQVRTSADDRRLGDLVAKLGDLFTENPSALQDPLYRLAASLAAVRGAANTFEFLVDRYAEAHSRRVVTTPRDTAVLMAELAGIDGGSVLDPACGIGSLLVAAVPHRPERVLAQDLEPAMATIAGARARLLETAVEIRSGDSLREDGFPGERVDVVLCEPPFGDRAWGYDELTSDPRWTYGLPPRGEPELAWVQHAMWHLKPGGRAVVLMPAAAADRRSGRRIRSQLVRAGALRAVVELPSGYASASAAPPHLWLLRRPSADDPLPSHVLMMNAAVLEATDVRSSVVARWKAFNRRPDEAGESGLSRAVPLVDLLDEVVDLTATRHVPRSVTGGPDFAVAHAGFEQLWAALGDAASLVSLREQTTDLPMTTVSELLHSGAVTQHQSPIKMETDAGDLPLLTAKDVMLGRLASGRASDVPGIVMLQPGDVVVPQIARQIEARVVDTQGVAAGPQLQVFRPDPQRCDPYFLACFLRAAGLAPAGSTASRTDVRRVAIPRLPLEDQRPYGVAFQRLQALNDALRALNEAGEVLVELGLAGLGDGSLRPQG
ncbi:N-6 DNA methylase [Actinomadura scrupuli]|uniref:N-6 DNA methylase n=1 Tax=Actinomadura scrupuli TaxID=559629 RepID=UPI003D96AF84